MPNWPPPWRFIHELHAEYEKRPGYHEDWMLMNETALEIAGGPTPPHLSILMLLATARVGPDARRVAAYINKPIAKVEQRASRFFKNRIWKTDGSFSAWWIEHAEAGENAEANLTLLLDGMVGEGQIIRGGDVDGKPTYQARNDARATRPADQPAGQERKGE